MQPSMIKSKICNYRICSKYLMNNTSSKILEEWWQFLRGKQMTFLASLNPYNIIKYLGPSTSGIWNLKKYKDRDI